MNTKIIHAYCKLSCFQTIIAAKYNLCKCNPYCKLLNNTLSENTSAYIQGPYARHDQPTCSCIDKCKFTHCTIDKNKYKHIHTNYTP